MKKKLQVSICFNKNADISFIAGDVFQKIKSLPDNSINLVVTSPPYNLNKEYEEKKAFDFYLNEMRELLFEIKRVLKKNGSVCWQVGNYLSGKGDSTEIVPLDIKFYDLFKDLDFKLRNRIIWHFRSGFHAKKRLSGRYETMLWFSKSEDYTFNLDPIRVWQKYQGKTHYRGDKKGKLSGDPKGMNPSDFWDESQKLSSEYEEGIWDFPNVKANHPEKTSEHPCQFPIELAERCIKAFSNEGDMVLDPFAGVGTTLIAAVKSNRKAVGYELEKKYISSGKKRIRRLENGKLPYRKMGRKIQNASGKVAKPVFEERNSRKKSRPLKKKV